VIEHKNFHCIGIQPSNQDKSSGGRFGSEASSQQQEAIGYAQAKTCSHQEVRP
jgi:hypothetical protein